MQGRTIPQAPVWPAFYCGLVAVLALLTSGAANAGAKDIRRFFEQQPIDLLYTNSPRPVHHWEVERFYASREYRPIWKYGNRLKQLQEAIAELHGDGLDPDYYPLPDKDNIDKAINEVSATAVWLQAALDLRFGRLDRSQLEPTWHLQDNFADFARESLLKSMLWQIDAPGKTLRSLRPKMPIYQALSDEYLRLYAQQGNKPWPYIAPGELIRPGYRGYRVRQLRERLAVEGESFSQHFGEDFYDAELTDAVKRFQYRHSLAEDGQVGSATLEALNTPRDVRLGQLRANLERWRWLEPELNDTMLLVNIAGAYVRYLVDGKQVWLTRTLVGRNERPTPSLKSQVSHLTFNPDWTIPPTIFKEDKLPKIKEDPDYLAEHHLQAISYDGRPLNPATVNWNNPRGILLRQPPGPLNPLGQVVIRFPNPFSVYLHDTPNKRLFGKARRAGSSGCVRVEDAVNLAYLLINQAGVQSTEEIDEIFVRGQKQNINLVGDIPLLMDYWTVDLDPAGRLVYQPDIYERDLVLADALE